jgi:acetyl esterase/lipase
LKIDRRALLGTALAVGLAQRAAAQTPAPTGSGAPPGGLIQPSETVDLWPGAAPGAPSTLPVETVNERSTDPQLTDRAVVGVSRPRMAVFRPSVPNGAAVLVMPGGGYRWVVVDKEGYELGHWLSARGFTVFVLFYRLPGEGWAAGPDVALSDAQRAMRLIRYRARDYGIDPERVAATGFSAGGHVAADLGTRFATSTYAPVDSADDMSARPFAVATIYPVVSMTEPVAHAGSREELIGKDAPTEIERVHSPHLNVPADAPPFFILHAEDDDVVPVENALLLRSALRKRRIPVETHLFTQGGHGFGLRRAMGKPVGAWPELFLNWARAAGLA